MTIPIRTSSWREAPVPAERPILAVGDVHGRLDLLRAIHRHLEEKVLPEARAHGTPLVAHLGDHIDRGPDSLGCLLAADAFAPEGCETPLLPGNREQMALDALDGREDIDLWMMNGGISVLDGMDRNMFAELSRGPLDRLRVASAARLEGCRLLSHAGVPRQMAPADVPAMSWRGTSAGRMTTRSGSEMPSSAVAIPIPEILLLLLLGSGRRPRQLLWRPPVNHLRHCPLGGSPHALDRPGCDGFRQPAAKLPGLKAVVPSPSRQKVLHAHRD